MTPEVLAETGAPSALAAFLEAARRLLGPDGVQRQDAAAARANVGLYRPRTVPAVLRPRSVAEVQEVIRLLVSTAPEASLYAVSTGRNWGLGSREPVRDGSFVLDLTGLDRVRHLDLESGLAVVEPGVTQGRLAARVAGSSFMLNVTASSQHTSILGNAMDRGVGLRGQRSDDVVGLEVVLADGSMLRTGHWPGGAQTAPYPHGIGPSLLPLFLQSNLGVVTAAVVRLLPRPERTVVISLRFDRQVLDVAVDELHRFHRQGLVHGVTKVYTEVAVEAYGAGPSGDCVAYACVDGSRELVGAASRTLLRTARWSRLFSAIRCMEGGASGGDVVEDMVLHAYTGDPSRNDAMLEAVFGVGADAVDGRSDTGWIFFLPIIPFSGAAVSRALALLESIRARTGVVCGSTVNVLSSDVVDFVVSIRFARTPSAVARAHSALDLLHETFLAAGFAPYRLDIDHMHHSGRLRDPTETAVLRRLKALLDPEDVIAPGRYV